MSSYALDFARAKGRRVAAEASAADQEATIALANWAYHELRTKKPVDVNFFDWAYSKSIKELIDPDLAAEILANASQLRDRQAFGKRLQDLLNCGYGGLIRVDLWRDVIESHVDIQFRSQKSDIND